MIFPVWFLQALVFGALAICSLSVIALLAMWLIDLRDRNIW